MLRWGGDHTCMSVGERRPIPEGSATESPGTDRRTGDGPDASRTRAGDSTDEPSGNSPSDRVVRLDRLRSVLRTKRSCFASQSCRCRPCSLLLVLRIATRRLLLAAYGTSGSQGIHAELTNRLERLRSPSLPSANNGAIATILSDMDAEIAALEHRLDKTRAIKQGMMQQLLTGTIRLPIPNDDTEDDHAHDA